jgi:hypothetical protein
MNTIYILWHTKRKLFVYINEQGRPYFTPVIDQASEALGKDWHIKIHEFPGTLEHVVLLTKHSLKEINL